MKGWMYVLYDDMIHNVLPGEVVEITGINRIESKRGSKSKKKTTVLHAGSIKYLNRKELVITNIDIINFQKFCKLPNLVERLVSMFAPNTIGHNDAKLGILRSVVGGIERGKIRGRINTFLVGDPGTAEKYSLPERPLTLNQIPDTLAGHIQLRRLLPQLWIRTTTA